MSVQLSDEIVGLDEGNKVLDEMFAAEQTTPEQRARDEAAAAAATAAGKANDEAGKDAATASQASTAAQAGNTNAQGKEANNVNDEAKAKADAEAKAKAEAADKGKQQQQQTADDAGKTRYEKATGRLQGSWKELNADKAAHKTERETWAKQREAEQAELTRQRAEFQAQREQAEQEFSPERYEAAAKKWEAEGKLDLADMARERAKQLRDNPPAKAGDRQEAARKEWTHKAAKEFPDLAKDNSPLQVRVSQMLKADAELRDNPRGIYLASRIASLEGQAAERDALKTSVTAKDKEIETLKARVTELESITAPGGGHGRTAMPGARTFDQLSDAEQLQQLEREAAEVGLLSR